MQTSMSQTVPFGAGQFPAVRADSTSAPDASTSSSTSSATVTANDFLQLLVTEMKNQDPTANTDPNEYINQLVQVNSLEQLVQINQDLGGSSSTGGDAGANGSVSGTPGRNTTTQSPATGSGTGNLALPGSSADADRVAKALGPPTATATSLNLQNRSLSSPVGSLRTGIGTAR
jgi:flagellar basal-body rod modification protein FlgD